MAKTKNEATTLAKLVSVATNEAKGNIVAKETHFDHDAFRQVAVKVIGEDTQLYFNAYNKDGKWFCGTPQTANCKDVTKAVKGYTPIAEFK